MKTAFVYARYSSNNQREESIDAQLRAIREYCEREHIMIVRDFVDRARSATTDNRPHFLEMIEAASQTRVDYVIVHKLDRFARNRFDSAFYRRELKKHGVLRHPCFEIHFGFYLFRRIKKAPDNSGAYGHSRSFIL